MKSGFVAIVGRPSAGKSTLLNAICGEKVAITSASPQTTRNAIRGIINTEGGQIVFLDTPGYHESEKKLNIYLKDVVYRSMGDANLVLYVIDATRPPGREEQAIVDLLEKSGLPVIVAINKIDADTSMPAEIRGWLLTSIKSKALINISAIKGTHLDQLISSILSHCPEGEPYYPKEFYTDQSPEFRISEIIREQALARIDQELPHALYVEIADMEFHGDRKSAESDHIPPMPQDRPKGFFEEKEHKNLWVRAFLTVEKESQVGILVGHKGCKIKEIRIASLREMRRIFSWKIRLDIRVKVNAKWRKKDPLLKRMMGFSD